MQAWAPVVRGWLGPLVWPFTMRCGQCGGCYSQVTFVVFLSPSLVLTASRVEA